jgi:hypothetical protein
MYKLDTHCALRYLTKACSRMRLQAAKKQGSQARNPKHHKGLGIDRS